MTAEARLATLGPGPYAAATPRTVATPDELQAELRRTNVHGFAIARDDAFMRMTALAAPIAFGDYIVA